jgi:hypothetical protein
MGIQQMFMNAGQAIGKEKLDFGPEYENMKRIIYQDRLGTNRPIGL